MLLRVPTSGRGASYSGGRRQPIPTKTSESVGSSFSSLSPFSVNNLWRGATGSGHGSRKSAPVKSKFEGLMTSSSRRGFSSNPPYRTQPPSIQLEVNPDDPLASFNDKMNAKIIAMMDPEPTAYFILNAIIYVVSGYKIEERLQTHLHFVYVSLPSCGILQKNPDEDTLMAGSPDNTSPIVQAFMETAEKAWNGEFIGSAAIALWDHMHYFNPGYTTNYMAGVQSFGMGKSRAIDEVSKTRFIIPLCLRPKGTIDPSKSHLTNNGAMLSIRG
ncbi:hypothetical protein M378DRAFT_9210 [Amanita muscaria Koide BX008]|uniref:Uncharacterized protein n=1 Tax=Amanita muscaria (strain Koide BX008) TaxID=946122 RepID=A0A0C2TLH7_AMAMK|nr:hypothetical protein M378DRAFT_9210 [Amanita muscaria Koide BX008]